MRHIVSGVVVALTAAACGAAGETASGEPSPAAAVSETPLASVVDDDELPVVLRGDGRGFEPLVQAVMLSGGDYVLNWQVEPPYRPGANSCSVSLDLHDADGDSALAGMISLSARGVTDASREADDLAAGDYVLWAYVDCVFEVSLDRGD